MGTEMKFPTERSPARGHRGPAVLLLSNHLHGSHGRGREPRSALTPQRVQDTGLRRGMCGARTHARGTREEADTALCTLQVAREKQGPRRQDPGNVLSSIARQAASHSVHRGGGGQQDVREGWTETAAPSHWLPRSRRSSHKCFHTCGASGRKGAEERRGGVFVTQGSGRGEVDREPRIRARSPPSGPCDLD